ncbi:hypothetical protein LSCM4_03458 [Leishmania orientalis]|uniref:Transmembrane protein n=1 Tax=Leishmania orientalis TaxID=2249476 RepID=A0A836HAL8_9TRYP|nr:hypothetical protein LSCM4_03458 [Leishmania orientalis]
MAAGTRRGLLLLAAHSFVVQSLRVVFSTLFVEYYTYGFLLVADTRRVSTVSLTDNEGGRLHFSKLGLGMLVAAQLVYLVCSVLHRAGVVTFSSVVARTWRPQRLASDEHSFAFVFGASWWVLRLPFLPSAVSFTLATAAVSVFSDRCIAFAQSAMREISAQPPKEEKPVQLALRAASGGAAVVVLIAALLYDSSSPEKGPLREFHWCLIVLCGAALCTFSGLQRWRCSFQGEDATNTAREDFSVGSLPVSGLSDATVAEFHDFVHQTWQRRSMKALLVVRALHCFAHTAAVSFFHLFLSLGCAPLLSAAVRAVILALVVAAPSFLAPMLVASAGLVGKKGLVSVMLLGVCAVGLVSLVAAFLTREVVGVEFALAVAEGSAGISPTAAVWLCAVSVILLRLLLDSVHDLLDLAQEDVVEEDAILFGRSTLMAASTKRLCSVVAAPMESLSRITTLLLLAFTNAFEGDVLAPPAITSSSGTTTTQATSVLEKAAPAGALEWAAMTNMASAVLAVLSLQTGGVALMMLVVWYRYYNLDGKHLQFVQMATRKRKDEQSVAVV